MKTGIRKLAERSAVVALAGVLTAGMFSGCGNEKLDGTKTVATVNGANIPLGVVSLYARQQQAYTESLYASMMGGADYSIWDTVADEESGETYGEQVVNDSLEQIERMYLMKEKAGDYGVEVTAEDQAAIADAAAAFMEDNTEEAIADLGVTEENVKTFLELRTYSEKIYDPIIADTDREVSDEEAQQSSFTYVSISALGEDLTAEEIETTKANAQAILDKMKEDPTADMDETAKSVDDTLSAYTGHFATFESEDGESSSYPDEVIEVLRGLEDGQVADEVIETDSSYYIVRLDEKNDEEETESHRESIISQRESEFYNDTLEKWLGEADIKVEDKVLKTLKVTDHHKFSLAAEETAAETETGTEEDGLAEEDSSSEDSAEVTATPAEDEAEVTAAPAENDAEATVTPADNDAEATVTPAEDSADQARDTTGGAASDQSEDSVEEDADGQEGDTSSGDAGTAEEPEAGAEE